MWDQLQNQLNDESVKEFIKCWNGDPKTLALISKGINIVYRFTVDGERFYLRVSHKKLRALSELEAAIAFQQHLFEVGVPVCQPVASRNAQLIEWVDQENDVFSAHVCKEVPGDIITFDGSDSALYEKWGACLAEFHTASIQYQFNQDQHHYGQWEDDIAELESYLKNEPKIIKDTGIFYCVSKKS